MIYTTQGKAGIGRQLGGSDDRSLLHYINYTPKTENKSMKRSATMKNKTVLIEQITMLLPAAPWPVLEFIYYYLIG